ncbi:GAF and ANTAR domain-containing protein [Nocardioides sp. HDW12B]|uniref:GAF and ANTAR domain-containing protein n=1 Tax=Nocardioides sp. HDW12B TaxID=2714939 RepID=UPI0014081051|nr:GAF and ANTAR domain-containing protein [Nocardioides sp. HDW12B]QIK65259.1 GAF and ANTAR domain-containing protein [Nocardioides sp. HDW12B]
MTDISDALAEAARAMGNRESLPETLQAIVDAARTSLPPFEVGVSTTAKDGAITTRAATSQTVWDLDTLQYELGEGPCLEAILDEGVVSAPAIRHDQRWPRYVPVAVRDHGLCSQFAVRMFLDEEGTVGGLNFYSTSTESIEAEDVELAKLFAAHAAVAFGQAREIENLNRALESRTVIGQAMGLVMGRYSLDQDAAFAFLRRASSHANIKLHDVAKRIVEEADRIGGSGTP